MAAAVEARIDAETAQGTAEGHETTAGEKKTAAVSAAGMELMLDGKTYSVGASSVDTTAKASSSTLNGQTTTTGLLGDDDQPMTNVIAVTGTDFQANTGTTADVEYVQAVATRDLTIGKTLDSSDDMARLMLVTHYAGSEMEKVYGKNADGPTPREGTKSGYVSIDTSDGTASNAAANANNTKLRSEGYVHLRYRRRHRQR